MAYRLPRIKYISLFSFSLEKIDSKVKENASKKDSTEAVLINVKILGTEDRQVQLMLKAAILGKKRRQIASQRWLGNQRFLACQFLVSRKAKLLIRLIKLKTYSKPSYKKLNYILILIILRNWEKV